MKFELLYYPLDDPLFKNQEEILQIYIDNYCNVIEIALPCDEPILDGKLIKDSMFRILKEKNIDEYFDDIKKIKEKYPTINIQLMSYSKIIRNMGTRTFCQKVINSNISYVLSPDADEKLNDQLRKELSQHGIDVILFSSLESTDKELKILKKASGYVFQRSTDGKTGINNIFSDKLASKIAFIKANINIPVVVGFGIYNEKQIELLSNINADGFVIGSALFEHILSNNLDNYLKQFNSFID